MSGPNAPPMIKMAMQQLMPQPAPRSDASQRIMAGRQMNVPQEQVVQRPGYRPPGQAAPPQAPRPPQAAPPQAAPPQQAVPLPRPRPQMPPSPQGQISPTDFIKNAMEMEAAKQRPQGSPTDFMKQALEMEAAKRNVPVGPVQAGPPVSSPEDFIKQVQAMQAGRPQTPTPGVREASPEEVKMAQQKEMAQKIAAQRSGGGTQAAPVAQGAASPPAPSSAASPPQAPPPVGVQPRGNLKRTVDASDKKFKYPKSTQKQSQAYGSSQSYYAILGVEPGDNVGAARAIDKLREKERKSPGTITMEEDKILAASSKIPAYNKSIEPGAVKQRFDERAKRASGEEEGTSVAPKADAAQAKAYATIDTAGVPPIKKTPTQEDINKNPGSYTQRNRSDVESDVEAKSTENED